MNSSGDPHAAEFEATLEFEPTPENRSPAETGGTLRIKLGKVKFSSGAAAAFRPNVFNSDFVKKLYSTTAEFVTKPMYELYKHFITLCSASILVVLAFMDKLVDKSANPAWNAVIGGLLALSIILFMLAIHAFTNEMLRWVSPVFQLDTKEQEQQQQQQHQEETLGWWKRAANFLAEGDSCFECAFVCLGLALVVHCLRLFTSLLG